jgi:hypothetical protein
VLVDDVEAIDTNRLDTLLRVLVATRNDGLRVTAVLALATSPALLLPRLPARACGHMEPFVYKLQTPLQAMDSALHELQVRPLRTRGFRPEALGNGWGVWLHAAC